MAEFKVGDVVRRKWDRANHDQYSKGSEFVVSEVDYFGSVYSSDHVWHGKDCLELVRGPLQVGDRVKVEYEGVVTIDPVGNYLTVQVESGEVFIPRATMATKIEPPEPPTPTNQEIWDSFPTGQRFSFEADNGEVEYLKVSDKRFYYEATDSLFYIDAYLQEHEIVPDN